VRFPEQQIEQVRAAADIVDVVSAHVPLKRQGQNHVGLCPFHQEKSPSFSVNVQKQIFHCFGCGVGGNVFTFLMKVEGLEFPEAVRRLADRLGIPVNPVGGSDDAAPRRDERERVRRINGRALEGWRAALAEAPGTAPVRSYLERRGLDAVAVEQFELGWAADEWDAATSRLMRAGEVEQDLLLAGVSAPRQSGKGAYDRFRGRLMFPIRAVDGTLVGFGGRVIGEGAPKYLNSPETPLYRKSDVLYGLYQARQAVGVGMLPQVAVVEGYLDVIACHRHGFPWAVAPLGTALTERHARLLGRYAERLDLVFDGDAAGRAAARKAAALLAPLSLEVRVVVLPAGEDPDSLLGKRGARAFQERLDAGLPLMEFLFGECLDGSAGESVERLLVRVRPVLEVLARIPDAVRSSHYIGRLAGRLGVDEASLRQHMAVERRRPATESAARHPESGHSAPVPATRPLGADMPHGESLLLHLVVQGAVAAEWFVERVSPEMFSSLAARRVAGEIATCVRDGVSATRVVDRLHGEPLLQGAVTAWLSHDAPVVEGDPLDCARSCVAALVRRETREVGRLLLEDIRRAESAGDTERLTALLRQKDMLTRTPLAEAAGGA